MLVIVCVAVRIATVPVVLGKVIVLSCVGSTTVSVVSNASAVEPSNTMLASTPAPVRIGAVRVLFVRVCVASVPTTTPSLAPRPCIACVPVPSL